MLRQGHIKLEWTIKEGFLQGFREFYGGSGKESRWELEVWEFGCRVAILGLYKGFQNPRFHSIHAGITLRSFPFFLGHCPVLVRSSMGAWIRWELPGFPARAR